MPAHASSTSSPLPPRAALESIIDRFAGCRILVVGDVILDRYIWGDVDRVSPEAPVPIVHCKSQELRLGGAANVISNLTALGARADLIGVTGQDPEADALALAVQKLGVPAAGLLRSADRQTTVKTRVMALSQQLLRLDYEHTAPLADPLERRLLARAGKMLARCDLLVLSDYGKGVLGPRVCARLIDLARAAGRPIVVDPKGHDYGKYRGATVIKPNLKEAEAAAGRPIRNEEDLAQAARVIQRLAHAAALIISRGGHGVSIFEPRRRPVWYPAQAQSVYDVTGAGDTFIAVMSLALAAGASFPHAAALGNLAGAVVVGKLGAATLTLRELRATLPPAVS